MAFNNRNNRCSISGYVSNISEIIPNMKSIELDVMVERPATIKGGKTFSDKIRVYICDYLILKFVIDSVKKGNVINVKGELRQWNDGTYKIAANDLTMKG